MTARAAILRRLNKTFTIVCDLAAQAAVERIKHLLSQEHVEYCAAMLSVLSTRTPPPVAWTAHSRVGGLNPFAVVTSVDVRCEPSDDGTTVTVHVNRRRGVLMAAMLTACWLFSAVRLPEPQGAVLCVGFSSAAWLGMVFYLGGYRLRKVVSDCLKN